MTILLMPYVIYIILFSLIIIFKINNDNIMVKILTYILLTIMNLIYIGGTILYTFIFIYDLSIELGLITLLFWITEISFLTKAIKTFKKNK